jgi:hypothetical protein
MNKNKEISGLKYFSLALLCFGGLAFDMVAMIFDKIIYGNSVNEDFFKNSWYVLVTHWTIVVILWASLAIYMYNWLKRRNVLTEVFNFSFSRKMLIYILAAIVASLLMSLFESSIWGSP